MLKAVISGVILAAVGYAWVYTYMWLGDDQHRATMIFLTFVAMSYGLCHHDRVASGRGGSQ
jgi:hypothetical protein